MKKAPQKNIAKLVAPQTTVDNIRSFVDACYIVGEATPQALSDSTKMSPRHVGYAAQASSILGLSEKSGRSYFLTPQGKALAESDANSEDERRILFKVSRESEDLQRMAPGLFANPKPSLRQLASRLRHATKLAQGTAEHRAAMLLKWRERLLQQQIDFRTTGMWRHIEITNFRSIKHASIRLAPFTVVVGPNASGKSNFVDAFVLVRDIATDASTAVSARGGIGGLRRWTKNKPTDVTIDLRAAKTDAKLEEPIARHSFKMHSGRDGAWSFSHEVVEAFEGKARVERKGEKVSGSAAVGGDHQPTASVMVTAKQLKAFRSVSALHGVYCYRLNPDQMRRPNLASDKTRLSESGDNIATAIKALKKDERIRAIVRPMSKIIPGLEDISIEQAGRFLTLKFKQAQGADSAEFNATEMSDGSLRALGIVVATHQMESDELLIIEEPEVSIHVGAANLLFDLLKEASEKGAVLVTTHSADLLDAAKDEEILVCEYSDGSTKIGPLAQEQREIVKKGLFSVSELMRSEPLRIESK